MPTAAVVAGPEPEIAPKNKHAITVAAPRPPVTGPAKLSAISTRRLEIPAASINAPARTKAGSAINGKLPTEVNAICTKAMGFLSSNI